MAQPDFLIIGAPKCGTTSLWEILRQHPDLHFPETKEPAFFLNDERYARGWDWYSKLFAGAGPRQRCGEATTEYSQTLTIPHIPERIHKHLPRVKLIFIARHPIQVLESRWRQSLYNRDPIPRNFANAIREYPPLIDNALHWRTVQDYLRYFPEDQLLLLFFEDLKNDPQSVARQCFRYIGVNDDIPLTDTARPRNKGSEKDMDTAWSAWLRSRGAFQMVRDTIPMSVRRRMRRITRRTVPERVVWDRATYDYVLSKVRDDALAFLSFAGRPAEFWEFRMPQTSPCVECK